MKYLNQHLQSAINIIQAYDGLVPMAVYLKNHFSSNKKFGSKDRRNITQFCYAYYRLGFAGKDLLPEQKIRIALFLLNNSSEGWQLLFEHSWLEVWHKSIAEKISFVEKEFPSFNIQDLFPWKTLLGKGLDQELFSHSFLIQPDLFLRLRPGKEKQTIQKLADQQILFKQISSSCLALPNASKLESVLELDTEVIVQDASSQKIAELLKLVKWDVPKHIHFWDCCAASGGKTILAKDIIGEMDITVSDIRHSILHNLSHRFQRAGIHNYHPIVTDLSSDKPGLPPKKYQLIFCDVPCTGSGTWCRTPEQLSFFKESTLKDFVHLQQKILHNTISLLANEGYFLFSTCSVFAQENEANTAFILAENDQLEIVSEIYLKGYEQKADTMYAVLFRKK